MSDTAKKVLIVEDEPALAKVTKNRLEAEGFNVEVLHSGVDVVEYVTSHTPDVVLLDLVMPKTDGFSVLKTIKGDPALAATKIIVLSNLSQNTDVDQVLELGAEEFLVKSDTPLSTVVAVVKKYTE